MRRRTIIAAVVAVSLAGLGGLAALHNVPREAAPADVASAHALMEEPAFVPPQGFDQQVALARAVQRRVLQAAPIDEGLPQGSGRELSDLVAAGQGLCYDRSRAIETILRLYGLETRHVAVYATAESGSSLDSLMTPGVPSHALSEVKTEKGWMLVDANALWVGLRPDGTPVDMAGLRRTPHGPWHPAIPALPTQILTEPMTWVYGLYSRHGQFYAPYTPIPDVNWRELLENLSG